MEGTKLQSEDEVIIEGTVEAIVWKDKTSDRYIVSLKGVDVPKLAQRRGYPNTFSAIGEFFKVAKGQSFRLFGKWQTDKRGRVSLIVRSHEEIIPENNESLVEYLSSGLFKGIGPKTAEAMVEEFGSETLNIIKNDPMSLTRVKGISGAKAKAIADEYQVSEAMEKLMLSLRPFEVPTKKIFDIHKRYGDEAMVKIAENPYRLCDEVKGIGFKTADLIAGNIKINPNDDFRVRAGILHTLELATRSEGHMYLPFELLVTKTKQELERGGIKGSVDQNNIIRIAIDLNNSEEIVIEEDGASFLPLYINSEKAASYKIKAMLRNKTKTFKRNVETIITDMQNEQKIEFAEQQKECFRKLPNSNMMIVTGGPGTGKTTIIKGIIEVYKRNFPGCDIILAAPTGKAAKRMSDATKMDAMTIHRHLGYKPSDDGGLVCTKNEKDQFDAELIVIDEFSMVDSLLFSTLMKAIKPSTSVVLVGDIAQLPSVGAGSVLRDLLESRKVPMVRLDTIFRQGDTSKIVVNAKHIDNGVNELDLADDFQFIEENDSLRIPELIKKVFNEELARVKDVNEVQVLSPYRRKTENGANELNVTLQESLNKKTERTKEIKFRSNTFRINDKVMQYKNNYEKEVYNGDIGTIVGVDQAKKTLLVDMGEEQVEYSEEDLEELELAYATTIHKSQGCEYDTVIIPLTMDHKVMLQRNLLYTGVTRAKTKVFLIGSKAALDMAIQNNKVAGRFSKLNERL